MDENGFRYILVSGFIRGGRYDVLNQFLNNLEDDDIDGIVVTATEQNDIRTVRYLLESDWSTMYPDLLRTATRTNSYNVNRYFMQSYPEYFQG